MSSASITSLIEILSLLWHNSDAVRISATLIMSMNVFYRSRWLIANFNNYVQTTFSQKSLMSDE